MNAMRFPPIAICLAIGLAIALTPRAAQAETPRQVAPSADSASIPSEEDPALAEARQAIRLRRFTKAVEIWETAARRGSTSAAYQLGVAYRSGRGVPKDLEKAAAWFEKAAAGGDPDAQYALGILCESGLGVARDRDRALDLLQRAARAGHQRTVETLKRIRASGSLAYGTADPRVALHRLDPRSALLQSIRLNDLGAAREALARGAPVDGARGVEKNPRPLILAIESGRPELVRILLEHRADANLESPLGEPALILALRSKDSQLVRPLLAAGASPNAHSKSGLTALMEAARSGSAEIVDLLLASGADPRTTLDDGSSAADVARRFGAPILAQRLQRAGAPVLGNPGSGTRAGAGPAAIASTSPKAALPPIVEAARRGDTDLLKKLLSRGDAHSIRDAVGDTALHRAAEGGHVESVRMLLAAGAEPDARGQDQTTPLMRAMASTAKSSDKVLEALIAAGADAHARDERGATAFHHGARGATKSKLARLRAAGAGWTERDAQETLVRAVVVGPSAAITAMLECVPESEGRVAALCAAIVSDRAEPITLLLEAGVPLDRNCGDGRSPLLIAIQSGQSDRLRLLLAAGANPEFAVAGSDTPLIGAASRGQLPIVSQLIAAGATTDRLGSHRTTALMGAAANGHVEIVRALLAAGADPRTRSETDRTAVDLARAAGHEEIAELIESTRRGWAAWLDRSSPAR